MMSKASQDEVAIGTAHPLLGRNYRIWLVVVLLLLSTLNFADRAILSILAQPIKEDLKLTDTELGMLQGLGFAILYSLLGLAHRLAGRTRQPQEPDCRLRRDLVTDDCGLRIRRQLRRTAAGACRRRHRRGGFPAARIVTGRGPLQVRPPWHGDGHHPAGRTAGIPGGTITRWLGGIGVGLARGILRVWACRACSPRSLPG